MKKLVLFVSVLALGLTSCNKDDDGGGESNIQGTWEFSERGTEFMGVEAYVDYPHAPDCSKDKIVIAASTYTTTTYSGTECTPTTTEATYARSGNTITVTTGDDVEVMQILQADSNTLKLGEAVDGQEGAYYVTIFTKQ